MALNIDLLESSFALVAPQADRLAEKFYDRLFREYPELREMFPEDMADQKMKLIAALSLIVKNLRNPDTLTEAVSQLGLRHLEYGVQRSQYPIIGENLLITLADIAGEAWTDEVHQAWAEAYQALVQIIFNALDAYKISQTAA